MSDKELSDAELIGLLGTYADALEAHETIAPAPEVSAQPKEGNEMLEKKEPGVVEVDVVPTPIKEPGRGRLLVGAAAVAVVALIGAVFVINQDSTELDTAQVVEDEAPSDTEDSDEVPADEVPDETDTESADVTDSALADGVTTEAAADSVAVGGFGGPNSVVFANGEFVRLGLGTVSRSSNGTDWTDEAVSGLPDEYSSMGLVEVDGRWATLIEVWPSEEDFEDVTFMFGPGPQPERLIGVSDDLVNWTTASLPEIDASDSEYVSLHSLAASGDRIAILMQIEPGGPDDLRILFEAGLLSEDDLENYCGSSFGENEAFVAYSCSGVEMEPDAAAEVGDSELAVPVPTTVSPREPSDEEELLRIEPGDPVYAELAEALEFDPERDQAPPMVITGPLDGPFETVEVPLTGYGAGLVGTDAGFLVIGSTYEDGAATSSSSVDGVTWSAPSQVASDYFGESLAESNGRIAMSGHSGVDGTVVVRVSDDLGGTWTESELDSELFGVWGDLTGGPAGFVMRLEGSTEPFDDAAMNPFGDDAEVSIEKDGYTMTINLGSGEATVVGPDGETIHDSIGEDVLGDGGADNVVRFEGRYDETIVWLDPATGDDLVAFDDSDMEAAFSEIEPQVSGVEYEEPPRGSEIWFSADGITWTLLDSDGQEDGETYSMVAGVGDDEVLVRTEQYSEPPAELLEFELANREPTDEEIAAIESWYAESNGDSSVTWTAIPVG